LFLNLPLAAKIVFAASLFLLLVSPALSLREVCLSADALLLQVHGFDVSGKRRKEESR